MKAVVIEIHKNYCIVMTGDGQFLKHKVGAGSVEIGDEIVISRVPEARMARFTVRGFAVAAAVVVVIIGGIYSYRYLSKFYPVGSARELAEAEFNYKDETQAQAVVTEEAEEAAVVLSESEKGAVDEVSEAGTLIYEKDFIIGEGIGVEEFISDLYFKYETFESDGEKQILVSFKNASENLSFTGSAYIIILFSDGSILKEVHVEFAGFGPQEEKEEAVIYEKGAATLRIRLGGRFN